MPKKYRMQVRAKEDGEWEDVAPSAERAKQFNVPAEPYEYDTIEEARDMLHMCYPDQCRQKRLHISNLVRVVEVEK